MVENRNWLNHTDVSIPKVHRHTLGNDLVNMFNDVILFTIKYVISTIRSNSSE